MKNVVFALFLLFGLSSCGMPGSYQKYLDRFEKDTVPYERTLEIPSLSKSDIYTAFHLWFAREFPHSESTIVYGDQIKDIISGKYVSYPYSGNIQSFIIYIKDAKVKVVIQKPFAKYHSDGFFYSAIPPGEFSYSNARDSWDRFVKSLEEYLLKYENSDW